MYIPTANVFSRARIDSLDCANAPQDAGQPHPPTPPLSPALLPSQFCCRHVLYAPPYDTVLVDVPYPTPNHRTIFVAVAECSGKERREKKIIFVIFPKANPPFPPAPLVSPPLPRPPVTFVVLVVSVHTGDLDKFVPASIGCELNSSFVPVSCRGRAPLSFSLRGGRERGYTPDPGGNCFASAEPAPSSQRTAGDVVCGEQRQVPTAVDRFGEIQAQQQQLGVWTR